MYAPAAEIAALTQPRPIVLRPARHWALGPPGCPKLERANLIEPGPRRRPARSGSARGGLLHEPRLCRRHRGHPRELGVERIAALRVVRHDGRPATRALPRPRRPGGARLGGRDRHRTRTTSTSFAAMPRVLRSTCGRPPDRTSRRPAGPRRFPPLRRARAAARARERWAGGRRARPHARPVFTIVTGRPRRTCRAGLPGAVRAALRGDARQSCRLAQRARSARGAPDPAGTFRSARRRTPPRAARRSRSPGRASQTPSPASRRDPRRPGAVPAAALAPSTAPPAPATTSSVCVGAGPRPRRRPSPARPRGSCRRCRC